MAPAIIILMQKTPFLHASRIFPALMAAAMLLVLSGCNLLTVTNLTSDTVPQNPSQIYTITGSFRPESKRVITGSIQPRIVIDGQSYPMNKSGTNGNIWEFDYQLPVGRTGASYYFICNYSVEDRTESMETYSDLSTMNIVGRYVLRPEASRAPIGSRVSVLGAGFAPMDVVYFDSTPARTVFESPSSLSFFVPAVEPGRSYRLSIAGSGNKLDVGSFRVDSISFLVTPSSIVLRSGDQQAVTFTIPTPAPAGGMLIEVTTDIPESIVMPEVIVPFGQTSVTIPVQGGKPGLGSLFFKSNVGESFVSVTVTAR